MNESLSERARVSKQSGKVHAQDVTKMHELCTLLDALRRIRTMLQPMPLHHQIQRGLRVNRSTGNLPRLWGLSMSLIIKNSFAKNLSTANLQVCQGDITHSASHPAGPRPLKLK